MSVSFLWDMWHNKDKIVEGLLSPFNEPTQEVKLGADWNREAAEANIPVDVGQIAQDVKTIVSNPFVALDAATGLLGGAWRLGLEKVMPEAVMDALGKVDEYVGYDSESDKAMASEAWQGFVATHGGLDELQKYGNEHPVYLAAELSGLGFLARQVTKMVAPAVVKAMVDIESRALLPKAINTQTSSPFGGQGLADKFTNQIFAGDLAAIRVGKSAELAKAKQLESEGVDAETIWKETGFVQAQDGGWRFEIDDSQASLKDMSNQTVDTNTIVRGEDYLNHPELFAAYPELKDIDVKPFKFNLSPSVFGYYDSVKPEIGINPVSQKSLEDYGKDPAPIKMGKTLHEFQHPIQDIEGHGTGSSPGLEAGKVFVDENLPDIRAKINNINLKLDELDSNSGSDLAQIILLLNRKTELEKELVKQDEYIREKGYKNYKNTLGELEAFQTQADVALTAEQRANRLPAYLLNKDARFADSALQLGKPALEKGLLGDAIPRLQPSDFKRNKDGTYVGFNKSINTPQKITKLLKQLEGLATEGADARFWYEDSSTDIMNLVNGDKVEAEKIAQILAITSQGANVQVNTGFAFKAYAQHKAGLPIETGRFPVAQSKKITDVLNGIPWEGRKTNSFYQNLMSQIDPSKVSGEQTTQDMWMARAFGLQTDVPGAAQYQIMEEITQNIATQNSWTPHQAQAAIWVATKARNESMRSEINKHIKAKGWGISTDKIKPEHQAKFDKYFQKMVYESEFNLDEFTKSSYSFADGIADNLGFVSLEAVPSKELTNVLPGIHNAPPEQVAEFTKSMYSIFLDEKGVDLLAKEIGMASPDNFMGFGGWDGEINPNVQVQGLLSGTIIGGINPADVQLVELYASVVGTVFKQDGVGYRRAFEETTISKQNGVDVDAGRRLTKEEHERIYAALQKQFGHDWIQPTSTGTGVDIVQYLNDDGGFDIPNAQFQKLVKNAIMVADIGVVDLVYYRSEGNLVFNDWKENPNGESYQIRENRTEKSQNLYRELVDKYSQEANRIRQEFEEKYGWGEAQTGVAAMSVKAGLLAQTKQKPIKHLLE